MGLIAEFMQLRMHFKISTVAVNSDLSMQISSSSSSSIRKKNKNIFRDVINKFTRSMEWHCSDCK